jgi:hypothetical protein
MILAACLSIAMAITPFSAPSVDDYDVVWTSPSKDAAGSMPIGNGEVVLNVWVEEATGDLLFYIARTDALSEISRILKLGRVRVHMDPSPFRGATDFRQTLRLSGGLIEISAGSAMLYMFVDARHDVIHLMGACPDANVSATVESWRDTERVLPKEEQQSAWSVHDAPFPLIESADRFVETSPNAVIWYHRNESSIVPKLWENQSLTGLPGTFDPIQNRTFGGRMEGTNLMRRGPKTLASEGRIRNFTLSVATHCAQTPTLGEWLEGVRAEALRTSHATALQETGKWWKQFWDRSWVFVDSPNDFRPPANNFPLRKGIDSNGQNWFPGEIGVWQSFAGVVSDFDTGLVFPAGDPRKPSQRLDGSFSLVASIHPEKLVPGRIFDKLTAGQSDGVLFDTHPGDSLRLIVGTMELTAPHCLKEGAWQDVAATYSAETGEAAIYVNGKRVAHRPAETGSPITRGYVLQRYVQAIQGRGAYPIKFNGGYYTVEPKAMGKPFNADWRNWGDCHWFQNVRHMYHPMLASGDVEMMEPFWKLYEAARPLAESRTKLYHGVEGAYFPETMTVFGTYSGGDYGWNRTGHQPKDVLCPWWDDAWNQGPELVALMLDRWDYTRDEKFLKSRVLPMAESVLRYFDTRFPKSYDGHIVINPTQVVETYWEGVTNDMPSTAGLIVVTKRLCELPAGLVDARRKQLFAEMKRACPELPLQTTQGQRELAPAQTYNPKTSNVENGELYAVWPFQVVSLSQNKLLPEAKRAYEHRKNRLDTGWGYDGNVAALLGMTGEAARILRVKCANSNPAYRWPATWGPNFDWLPDQNHGGNLLTTTQLMLLQADPIEQGGAIRVLPACPADWKVDFKLHAPGKTVVRCIAANGVISKLEVTPASRAKDLIIGDGWKRP